MGEKGHELGRGEEYYQIYGNIRNQNKKPVVSKRKGIFTCDIKDPEIVSNHDLKNKFLFQDG